MGENFGVMGQTRAKFDPYFSHWADQAARQTMAANPEAESFVVAAGITPSGVVHVGNFREVITVDLVARALRDQGIAGPLHLLLGRFRRLPQGAERTARAGDADRRTCAAASPTSPIPSARRHDSYASHHIEHSSRASRRSGSQPEFIRQSVAIARGVYAEGIRRALEKQGRDPRDPRPVPDEPLPRGLAPARRLLRRLRPRRIEFGWDGEWTVELRLPRLRPRSTSVDLREGGDVKLPWRIDWPMRWAYEGVCFEPGGKDHSSAGGSYDTAKQIVGRVYDGSRPEYVAYDFVRIKGGGGKISSSAGDAVTVADCLEVYEPEMLRWIFASQRPNSEFQISFDLDVIKLYEDYDRASRSPTSPTTAARRTRSGRWRAARSSSPRRRPPRSSPGTHPFARLPPALDDPTDLRRGPRTHARALRGDGFELERRREAPISRTGALRVELDRQIRPDAFRYRIRSEATVREPATTRQRPSGSWWTPCVETRISTRPPSSPTSRASSRAPRFAPRRSFR